MNIKNQRNEIAAVVRLKCNACGHEDTVYSGSVSAKSCPSCHAPSVDQRDDPLDEMDAEIEAERRMPSDWHDLNSAADAVAMAAGHWDWDEAYCARLEKRMRELATAWLAHNEGRYVCESEWATVPREPTPEMLAAAGHAFWIDGSNGQGAPISGGDAARVYSAMLLAAPSAVPGDAGGVEAERCAECNGHGKVIVGSGASAWPPRMTSTPCEACNGTGRAARQAGQQQGESK